MTGAKKTYVTQEGIRALETRLEYLKTTRRQEVAQRIKEARALGDLSENSEYDDAKNDQAFVEGEIASIEQKLRTAELVVNTANNGKVSFGSAVQVRNVDTDAVTQYVIVGSEEADPFAGRISNESPMGAALLHRAVGEMVEVETPGGHRRLSIESIQ